jgi:predicted amidohydrolase
MRIALAQSDVAFGDVDFNLAHLRERVAAAAHGGAELVVFPECFLTGYAFSSAADVQRVALEVPGPVTGELVKVARESGVHLVVGLIERAAGGARNFNTALLVGPDGIALHYRKLHLPVLGCDRFVAPGDLPLAVANTPLGRIGLSICYDGSFPETARALKLRGAQLVVLPTNWPEQATVSRRFQSMVRAFENHVNYVACNRIGSEGGFKFPGGSQGVDFSGHIVAQGGDGAEILFAELDLARADDNKIVHVAGEYELDRIAHRRPEHYGALVEPPRPRTST